MRTQIRKCYLMRRWLPLPPRVSWAQTIYIQWFAGGWCLQNRHNKGVIAKFGQINELAPDCVRGCLFLISISSIANWVKLKCQVLEIYIWFVMCGLARFREVWGLDMRFCLGFSRKIAGTDQAGKLREGRVAMIFWVSREMVMTWPMRR